MGGVRLKVLIYRLNRLRPHALTVILLLSQSCGSEKGQLAPDPTTSEDWAVVSTPVALAFTSICAAARGEYYLLGNKFGGPIVLKYDGVGWSTIPNPSIDTLLGVAENTHGDQELLLTGFSDQILAYDPRCGDMANNSCWKVRSDIDTREIYNSAIYFGQQTKVFVVGGYELTDGSTRGWVYGRENGIWSTSLVTTPPLHGIWGSADNNVYVVGSALKIFHFDGSGWAAIQHGKVGGQTLNDVWGIGGALLFAVGDDGTILYFDGNSWEWLQSGVDVDLYGVWGSSTENVFCVGANGIILRYDGNVWVPMKSGTSQLLRDVTGTSDTDVLVVGDRGVVLRYLH